MRFRAGGQAALSADGVLPTEPLRRLGRSLVVVDQIGSTNAHLLEHASELPDGAVLLAEVQTHGRGRQGRRWEAPKGSSILLSALLHEPADSPLLQRATTIAALAASEAIESSTDCGCAVRWPNDLTVRGRKVGGVLAEARTMDPLRRRAIAIGIGVNCWQQPGHFSPELRQTATSLEIESRSAVDRSRLAACVLERLDARIQEAASEEGWADVLAAWRAACADLGARVTLVHDGASLSGTIIDVAADGDLVVELDSGGRRTFGATTSTRLWSQPP